MSISIDTGVKAYWLGALFLMLIISSAIKIIGGFLGVEISSRRNLADSIDGGILLVICLGWWFAE